MEKSTHIGDTVRIRRPPKVVTDELGHNVWMSGLEPVELELEGDGTISFNPYDTAAGRRWSRKVRALLGD
ncbi:MAG: hypothetical protein AAFX56_16950 [Pseudomonadota bacterium]